jgi:hypothetical protein
MPLTTAADLYRALRTLLESERDEQKALEKQFKKRKVHKEEELEEKDEDESLFGDEEGGDEPDPAASEEDPETGDEENKDEPAKEKKPEEKKDGKLAGAEELTDTPQELPASLKGSDFIDKINKIRAGASLQDNEVQGKVVNYVRGLSPDERNDLWVNLDSLARIILGGVDPAQVLTPSLLTGPNKSKGKIAPVKTQSPIEKEKKKVDGPVVSPVTVVGEGVKKKLTEVPYVLRSNKTVPFGHTAHVKDLERIYSDLLRLRSCQEPKSESFLALTLALRTIKSQLAMAHRRTVGSEKTIDVSAGDVIPPLVEES